MTPWGMRMPAPWCKDSARSAGKREQSAYRVALVWRHRPGTLRALRRGGVCVGARGARDWHRAMAAVRRRTSTIPIVFTNVTDPIGQGFVQSLANPGGRTIQSCLNDLAATL